MVGLIKLIFIVTCINTSWSLFCKDENGINVDWYLLYKIPYLQEDQVPLKTGFAYAFLSGPAISAMNGDLPDEDWQWHLSKYTIKDKRSFLGQTMDQIYSQVDHPSKDDISFIMYNDSPPPNSGKESSSLAHAKGVVAMDSTSGFWMIHSIPNFAEAPDLGLGYRYPDSGRDNGQTVLCISFPSAKESKDIATQLLYMRPNVYNISISDDAAQSTPQLMDLKKRKWPGGTNWNIATIDSIRGKEFVSFSRNSKAALVQHDLYADLIAPHFTSNLYVETWRRGAGTPLPSNCSSKYHVQNIESVKLKFSTDSEIKETSQWPYLEDHSKWAVGADRSTPYVCVGDINRMASQFKRGGGSVCIRSTQVWSVLEISINAIEGCPRVFSGEKGPTSGVTRHRSIFASMMTAFYHFLHRSSGD